MNFIYSILAPVSLLPSFIQDTFLQVLDITMRSTLIFGVLAVTALAQYRPQVPIEARSLDEIYLAAKAELNATKDQSPLRVFWGGDDGAQGQGVINAWKAQFPDIPLNLSVDL